MTSPSDASNAAVIAAFTGIPALLDQAPALILRGRTLDCECRLGPMDQPFHASIRAGRIIDLTPAPVLMRSWRFSYRASSAAWTEFWKPVPRPGWHDLFALTKREEAVLEGDLHPFMAHLQYFKDVLALPRPHRSAYFYRVDGDLRGRVEGIDTGACPLYLLTGEYDFSCTPEDTRRTAAAIKGASVTIMEQLSHFPMSENPEQFRRYIAPVLSQILGQTTFDKQGEHV